MNKYEEYMYAIKLAVNAACDAADELELDHEDVKALMDDAIWYVANDVLPNVKDVLQAYVDLPEHEEYIRVFRLFRDAARIAKQGIELGYLPRNYNLGVELRRLKI